MERLLQYAVALFGAAGLCLYLTPLALGLAERRGLLDHPGVGHKQHAAAVPLLGGAAIVGAFLSTVLVCGLFAPVSSGKVELAIVLGAAALLAGVGLLDDLRGLGPAPRFVAQVAAGVAILAAGAGVRLTHQPALDAALTILWTVGITNAFNLLDNMDGLSAGVAAIAATSFLLIAAVHGQYLVATLAAALAGCAAAFLRHNLPPARVYMGDAGSMFLGFCLAYLGLKLEFEAPVEVTFLVPILVLGVAIFDTSLVVATRLRTGRNPLSGGRDHTSHRLVFLGLPPGVAVGLIYGCGAALGWLGLVVSRLDRATAYLLAGLVLTFAVVGGLALGSLPVYTPEARRMLLIRTDPNSPERRSQG